VELVDRFFMKPEGSFFLFGPRGTGKSTWAQIAFKDALIVDLLDSASQRRYLAKPERLLELVRGQSRVDTVLIDEVQKVPALLDAVHRLMEERGGLRFVLTGSSARKIKRTGADLLAGRALLRTMHPFMAGELGPKFSLDSALRLGLLPVVMASAVPEETLASYVALYLKEEVQAEGIVRNIGAFARFLEIISFSHGACLNVSNVARESEIERKTVDGYIEVLEDLLIGFRLPVFKKRAKRKVSEHPKFYYFDAGVFRSLRPQGPLDRPEEIEGAAHEGLVAQHLRAWIGYQPGRNELYFWRTRSGVEVDFVVYGDAGFWAIEVKNTDRVRDEDLRALMAFREDFPESRALFVYRGSERLARRGILCLPSEEFLRGMAPGRPLEYD
jgi:predicted AAA+ superfamily ATPase